jgi:hypothetical protein
MIKVTLLKASNFKCKILMRIEYQVNIPYAKLYCIEKLS